MGYAATAILGLASQCAPNVAPQTVAAIVQTESHGERAAERGIARGIARYRGSGSISRGQT